MAARASSRPIPWFAFGTGGFVVAFLLPIQVLLYGIAIPLGLISDPGYKATLQLLEHPLTRIYLFVVILFALLHAAYRIKDTVCDVLDIRQFDSLLGVLCYGGVAIGAICALVLLWNVP